MGFAGQCDICGSGNTPSSRARSQWEGEEQIFIKQELHGVQSCSAFTTPPRALMWVVWEPPCNPAGCARAGTPRSWFLSPAQPLPHPMAPGKGLGFILYFLSGNELSISPSPCKNGAQRVAICSLFILRGKGKEGTPQ